MRVQRDASQNAPWGRPLSLCIKFGRSAGAGASTPSEDYTPRMYGLTVGNEIPIPVKKRVRSDSEGEVKGNQKAAQWSNESKYSKLKKH